VHADQTPEDEHRYAHQVAIRAALSRLEALATRDGVADSLVAELRFHYEEKLQRLTQPSDGNTQDEPNIAVQQWLHREVLQAERAAVIELRDQGHIDDEVLRTIERELDIEEQRRHH
jgi:monovalent cation/hydrogen antiporter